MTLFSKTFGAAAGLTSLIRHWADDAKARLAQSAEQDLAAAAEIL